MGFLGNWFLAAWDIVRGRKLSGIPGVDSFYSLKVTGADGADFDLAAVRGKVVLVVNTATGCGFAPQFSELEALQRRFGPSGFLVLGFPSNDFLGQEPKSDQEIKEFCQLTYDVSFPLMKKAPVGGREVQQTFQFLTTSPGHHGVVLWNFEKFLIDKKGRVVGRWRSAVKPLDAQITEAIERTLSEPA